MELADRMNVLQVEALCWCGKRATHNARTENGAMVTDGEVVVVGDVDQADEPPAEVAYEVLCRQHHRRRLTAARAKAVSLPPSRSPSAERPTAIRSGPGPLPQPGWPLALESLGDSSPVGSRPGAPSPLSLSATHCPFGALAALSRPETHRPGSAWRLS